MSNIVNLITMEIDADIRERFMETLLANAAATRKEPGNVTFEVSVKPDDENAFLFYEVFESQEALEFHRETPHFQKYWNMMQELGSKARRVPTAYKILDA